jgi:hypothetical protein
MSARKASTHIVVEMVIVKEAHVSYLGTHSTAQDKDINFFVGVSPLTLSLSYRRI